jgi:hypothetical protein
MSQANDAAAVGVKLRSVVSTQPFLFVIGGSGVLLLVFYSGSASHCRTSRPPPVGGSAGPVAGPVVGQWLHLPEYFHRESSAGLDRIACINVIKYIIGKVEQLPYGSIQALYNDRPRGPPAGTDRDGCPPY